MHGLAILGALFVRETGAGYETARGFVGMIEGGEEAPSRIAGMDRIIRNGIADDGFSNDLIELFVIGDGRLGEVVDGVDASEEAKLVFMDHCDASAMLAVFELDEACHEVEL
jgi:hypothetical protein